MKEFIEKLIGRLEEIEEHCVGMLDWQGQSAIVEAISIVNQLAEEYNNGWIPLSKQKPTERKSYLVSHGQHTSVYIEEWNGMYFTERHYAGQPIAWQPLPDAYTEGE